jgi:hypothetical protein
VESLSVDFRDASVHGLHSARDCQGFGGYICAVRTASIAGLKGCAIDISWGATMPRQPPHRRYERYEPYTSEDHCADEAKINKNEFQFIIAFIASAALTALVAVVGVIYFIGALDWYSLFRGLRPEEQVAEVGFPLPLAHS